MNSVEHDIEVWFRRKLLETVRDAQMRFEIAEIENGHVIIAAVLVELGARGVAGTTMPPDRAGQMFCDAILDLRQERAERSR